MLEKLTEGPQINEVVVVFPTRETTTSVAVKIMNVKEREKKKRSTAVYSSSPLFHLPFYLEKLFNENHTAHSRY